MSGRVHEYSTELSWSGSTGVGYEQYDPTHRVSASPAATELTLSSDPAFRGNPQLLNPEQLLVLAASSCQLLSFLAVAARARIDVRGYRDRAHGVMPEDELPVRITRIVLRPEIDVATGPTEEKLRYLCEVAHRECYISRSLKTDVVVEPTFRFL